MGDGRVALILDALGLAQRSGVISEVHDRILAEAASRGPQRSAETHAMLLFGLRGGGRMALPLSSVTRLEEFPYERVERSGEGAVVQYRGEIMPLVVVSEVLVERRRQPRAEVDDDTQRGREDGEKVQVVVHIVQGRYVGLVVDRILDIVEEAITVQSDRPRSGTLGAAVIQGRVTELLDVDALMALAPRARRTKASGARQASAS